MMNWNKNEWQGKRKTQIGYSEAITIFAMALLLVTVAIIVLTN